MKLLVDQNVARGLVERLRADGYEAVHTSERGLSRADDADLVALARQEARIIVTYDGDFARLVALSGEGHPSVIHLRLGTLPVREVHVLLQRVLTEARPALLAGAVVALREDGYRLQVLPIRR